MQCTEGGGQVQSLAFLGIWQTMRSKSLILGKNIYTINLRFMKQMNIKDRCVFRLGSWHFRRRPEGKSFLGPYVLILLSPGPISQNPQHASCIFRSLQVLLILTGLLIKTNSILHERVLCDLFIRSLSNPRQTECISLRMGTYFGRHSPACHYHARAPSWVNAARDNCDWF